MKIDEVIKITCEKMKLYKNVDDLEIEFRLGTLKSNNFNSSVNEIFFNKVLNVLNGASSSTSSFKKKSETYIDYFYNDIRTRDHSTFIKKERLCILDFYIDNSPLDLRISFTREINVPKPVGDSQEHSPDLSTFTRKKTRHSFGYKHWSYDLTKVSSEVNSLQKTNFEIELEIVKPSEDLEYLAKSSLLKISDLLKMCEDSKNPYIFTQK